MLVLFVCTANISRSPYAELRARQMLDADPGGRQPGDDLSDRPAWAVASAGIPGLTDNPMDPGMRRWALERGVAAESCDAHRSRPLSAELVEASGLILTMEKRHRNDVLDAHPSALGRVLTLAQAAQAARRLLEAQPPSPAGATELVRRLVAAAPRATARHDVPDPYRRGEEASRRAASLIDDYLVTITSVMCGAPTPLATVATQRGGAT